MRTTTVTDLMRDFQTVLGLVAAGEEVEVTREERVVAKFVPQTSESSHTVVWPDLCARARSIVGKTEGTPLSKLIMAERGERL